MSRWRNGYKFQQANYISKSLQYLNCKQATIILIGDTQITDNFDYEIVP